jgi:dihydrofolate reductase
LPGPIKKTGENNMRKLIFGINLTIDGCCDHTRGIPGEDVHQYFTQLVKEAGVLLYGRKTYQLMVPFWPDFARNHSGPTNALNEFARAFDAVGRIVVFSRTLENVDDPKTTIVRTDLKTEILKLKQEAGKDILVGGVSLPSQLIELGLVDEYHFMIHPVLAGEGRRLDSISLAETLQLKLVASRVFESGFVALRYVNP